MLIFVIVFWWKIHTETRPYTERNRQWSINKRIVNWGTFYKYVRLELCFKITRFFFVVFFLSFQTQNFKMKIKTLNAMDEISGMGSGMCIENFALSFDSLFRFFLCFNSSLYAAVRFKNNLKVAFLWDFLFRGFFENFWKEFWKFFWKVITSDMI